MQQNNSGGFPVSTQIAAPAAQRLHGLLARGDCLVAPETPDGLMSKLVRQAGFEVAFVGLLGSALNRIGTPDAGLLTATELVDNAARVIDASGLPTVVDIGSGFGNPINVRRTVAELERCGAAAVVLGDAVVPAAHRHASDSIAPAEMVAKLRAARDAQQGPGLLLVAAIAAARGQEPAREVVHRARLYRDAGADLIALMTDDDAHLAALARELHGTPLACRMSARSSLGAPQLQGLGIRLALFPHIGLMAAVPAIEHTFSELQRTGSVGHLRAHIADFRTFTDIAGLPAVQQLEERYGVPDEQRTTL
jgi:2-methylisocitrate lyase-like PEP mutase family enzyme